MEYNLDRFIKVQEDTFIEVINQLKNGKKSGHWMWYYFPQISGLGMSSTAKYYEIKNIDEAVAYYKNKILGSRLIYMCELFLNIKEKNILKVLDYPDDLKLKSSMTLFYLISKNDIFNKVLDKYFDSRKDLYTIKFIEKEKNYFNAGI